MTHMTSKFLIVLIAAAAVAVSACSRKVVHTKSSAPVVVTSKHHGPPPHAPAHGYRHKHPDGVVLVFQASLGLYLVSGHRDTYYHRDHYYRLHRGTWEMSQEMKGPWHKVAYKKLPRSLQNKSSYAGKSGKGKGKGKGKGNGKRK